MAIKTSNHIGDLIKMHWMQRVNESNVGQVARVLTGIPVALSIADIALADSQVKPPVEYNVRYSNCGFLEGAGIGFFGFGLLFEDARGAIKCVTDEAEYYLDPRGKYACKVSSQDGEYTNKTCPSDVFKQVQDK